MQALTIAALLTGARCEVAILRALETSGARVDAIVPSAPDPTGARVGLLPTGALGFWVRLTVDPEGEVLVERVSARAVESLRFGPRCEPVNGERRERPIREDGWTDAALAETIERGDVGAILLWSPHMPLSVDAYGVLETLTLEMGIALVPILDPSADPAYAGAVAHERGIPSSALRPLSGIELAFRGMTTHAPSLQVFARGRLVGPVVPGYRDREGFRLAIERALGKSP